MIIRSAILWSSLAILAGTGVLLMKNEVETEERHLLHIKKSIVATEQSLHVLRAEWSYLNDPLRLRLQAEKHLGLKPMRANQIMTLEQIPRLGDSPSINNFSDPESGNIPQNTITNIAKQV